MHVTLALSLAVAKSYAESPQAFSTHSLGAGLPTRVPTTITIRPTAVPTTKPWIPASAGGYVGSPTRGQACQISAAPTPAIMLALVARALVRFQ